MTEPMVNVLVVALWLVLIFSFAALCAAIYTFIYQLRAQMAMDYFERVITDQLIRDQMPRKTKPIKKPRAVKKPVAVKKTTVTKKPATTRSRSKR